MCGRYVLTSPPDAVDQVIEIEGPLPNYPPRYNIAPTQPVPVIHRDGEGKGPLHLSLMRWGLVPHWSKGPDSRYSMINARAETIAQKPAYRGPFRYRRCLMPANGFYEWKAAGQGPKQPYFLSLEDQALFFLAAVWDHWLGPDGSEIDSVSVVTTAAAGHVRDVHDRMPVILDAGEGRDWIDGAGGKAGLDRMMTPRAMAALQIRPVSRKVNNVRFDDPVCLVADDN